MDTYAELAARILPLLGGPENIRDSTHCMTRLRVDVVDPARIDEAALRATPGVLGVVEDETYQIVLGPGVVTKVSTAFVRLVEGSRTPGPGALTDTADTLDTVDAADPADPADTVARGARLKAEQKARNNTPLKNLLRTLANIFVPLIPALIGAGLVAAVRGLLVNLVAAGDAAWAEPLLPALTVIGTAFLSYLAIFAGINAAKEFGGTPALGGAVAAIIVVPSVADITYTMPFVGEVTLSPGQGGVLGAILAAALCAGIERLLRGRVPDALDILVTPTVALLVSGLVTIYALMFLAGQVSTGIADAATWLFDVSGVLAGFVLGGLFLPVVMLGLHQALIPIHATLIEQVGYTSLLPILAMAGAGQVGCALAVLLKLRRNRRIRDVIKGALPVGVLGVGEPLIYGVSLPLGRPFVTACFGGAVGGAVLGAFNQLADPVGATAIGPSGWALLPLVTGPGGQGYSIAVYALGLVAGYVAGFVATWFFGFPPALLEEHDRPDGETGAAATPAGALPSQGRAAVDAPVAARGGAR